MDSTKAAMQNQDTAAWHQELVRWEQAEPNSPDLAASWFNYYYIKADQEVLQLSNSPSLAEDGFIISDSTGPVGSLTTGHAYNQKLLDKGFAHIDQALKRYPNRLDLWFGKIYVIGLTEDWEQYTQNILEVVQQGAKNKHNWLWSNDEPVEDGEAFFLASLQDYQVELLNTQEPAQLEQVKTIALEVLKHHPLHVESMTNIAIGHLIKEEYLPAEEWLKKAEQASPDDLVVAANLAYVYRRQEKLDQAKWYYEKLVNSDDPDYQAYGQQQLESLKN